MAESFKENEEIVHLRAELERERTVSRAAEGKLARHVLELERSNTELEQFAYAASHDLQEPLRMVAQFGALLHQRLQERHPDAMADEEVALFLAHMQGGADRAKRLIDGLLSYSRVGRQVAFGPFQLGDALDDAVEMLNGAVTEAGASITRGDLPAAWGDRSMVSRVFLNLITNAIRFARDEPARVHVSVEDDGDEWVVSVSDNGIGIEPRHAERIFGLFQRLNPTKPGTGLGLAICKKIVDRHGGRIWVESSPGSGATFKFTISKAEPTSSPGV
jgi:light-regulated signal transduction histidine kinase (bacteriophytochrome)